MKLLYSNMSSPTSTVTDKKVDSFQEFSKRVLNGSAAIPITNDVSMTVDPSKIDTVNKKALEVAAAEGESAFIKHVFTDQDTSRALTYAEMRSRYG